MENRGVEFPERVWECLNEMPFDTLEENDRILVLSCMSKEEYDKMHVSIQLARTLSLQEREGRKRPVGRKAELTHVFDAHHAVPRFSKDAPGKSRELYFWRVAAALLLLLCGYLCYERQDTSKTPTVLSAVSDTVIRIREKVVTRVIHDTFLMAVSSGVHTADKKAFRKAVSASSLRPRTAVRRERTVVLSDVYIVTPTSLDNRVNGIRGNRRKDDSLAERFATVSL